jgi:hypothetical protein
VAFVTVADLPLPRWTGSETVIEPPGTAPGSWAGAPSTVRADGHVYLAYRLRKPITQGRGFANVVARSRDGVTFDTLCEVDRTDFGGESLERPALVRTPEGRWRLYVSVATPGTKHWRVDLLEAEDPEQLSSATPRTVLPGDESIGVKDPVIYHDGTRWHLWASVHPLDVVDHEDRMTTWYATSGDGVDWTWSGPVLHPRHDRWDARGTRVTAVFPTAGGLYAAYDGRASAAENWEERTGLARARRSGDGSYGGFTAADAAPVESPYGGLRYLDVLRLADGRHRLYYEATRADGAHELRTEIVPVPR